MNFKPRSTLPQQALKVMPPARRAAFLALERSLGKGDLPLQAALDLILREQRLGPKDAPLATNLTYETCRHQERLHWLLGRFLKRPERLAPAHKDILLLAACELIFMEGIPPYASLNWAVEAVKTAFGPALGGLSNAVLRKVAALKNEARDYAFFAAEIKDRRELLSVWFSQPLWLVDHFTASYPEAEARAYLEAFIAEPALGLRVNARRPDWQELAARLAGEPGRLADHGHSLAFAAAHKPADLEQLIREGRVSRQSYAAQEALDATMQGAAAAKPEFRDALQGGVWDACAGHGGKTCALLEQGIPVVLASDIHSGRLAGLREDMERLGLFNLGLFDLGLFSPGLTSNTPDTAPADAPAILLADAAGPCPLPHCPPVILADVPCSGLGTLNRRPDIKYKRSPADLSDLALLQARITDNLYDSLPPQGWLLYVTCTLNPAENQDAVAGLLARRPGAELVFVWRTPPDSPAREFFYGAAIKKNKAAV